jgi:HD-GYP domain
MCGVILMRYVPSACLRPGQDLAVDLIMEDNKVFLKNKVKLTETLIGRIKVLGFQGAYIEDDISKDLVVAHLITEEIKAKAKQEISSLFNSVGKSDDVSTQKSIKRIEFIVEDLVGQILKKERTMVNIVDIRTFDDYTYSHSLNVAVLSIVIGTVLELDRKILQELAVSAIIHDIGKVFIDKNILNKPQKLTPEEFSIVKEHALKGYQYLRNYNKLTLQILRGVLEHHEQFNGNGYPKGLSGDQISFFGKIICIADVYDALTSDRPFRRAMVPSDAIEFIMSGYNTFFDSSIVDVFIRKVAAYPVGTCVELSDGKQGIVIGNNEGFGLRPVIRILEEGRLTEHVLNLNEDSDKMNITIKQIIDL